MFRKASKCKEEDRQSGKKKRRKGKVGNVEWENDREITPNEFGFESWNWCSDYKLMISNWLSK